MQNHKKYAFKTYALYHPISIFFKKKYLCRMEFETIAKYTIHDTKKTSYCSFWNKKKQEGSLKCHFPPFFLPHLFFMLYGTARSLF